MAETPVPVAVGTHFVEQTYLYAFAVQGEVVNYVRTQAIPEEAGRLPEILRGWEALRPRVAELESAEAGVAEQIAITAIPDAVAQKVQDYVSDPSVARSFQGLPTGAAMVEIDKLVAPQRTVNVTYVDKLRGQYQVGPTLDDLAEICVAPTREMDPIQHLEVAPNTHIFTSPNGDVRPLGAFLKPNLELGDAELAQGGGIPAAGIVAFVGYGAPQINVILANNRAVLNNGFHRVYALRSLGVTHIPVLVQNAATAPVKPHETPRSRN